MIEFQSLVNLPRQIKKLILIFFGITILGITAIYAIVTFFRNQMIEQEALRAAELVAAQVQISRSTFTAKVFRKLQDSPPSPPPDLAPEHQDIPIPAEFMRLVGEDISNQSKGLFHFSLVSKWNLHPDRGLQDDFQRWAWKQLERQDQQDAPAPIDWVPRWRFETIAGVRTLRYMKADPADQTACVDCHNALERTPALRARRIAAGLPPGRQWALHQLLGAIEVQIPIDNLEGMEANQDQALLLLLLVFLCGLSASGIFAITGLRSQLEAAEYFHERSKRDVLTGLGNRDFFEEHGKRVLETARRLDQDAVLMFIDLDDFKPINDLFGHQIGDVVLREASQRLAGCIRNRDVLARVGGDEFVMLLREEGKPINYEAIAEKIIKSLSAPINAQGVPVKVSASIGVSCYPAHGSDLTMLIECADGAMYDAKDAGGHCYRVWGPA